MTHRARTPAIRPQAKPAAHTLEPYAGQEGSQLELAPQGLLATYLEALHAAPDTQAHVAANTYVAPGAEAAAEDGGHSDHD